MPNLHSSPNTTDSGNAERLYRAFGGNLRYCPPLHSWYIWEGSKWVEDVGKKHVTQMAMQIADRIRKEALEFHPEDERVPALHRWARQTESLIRVHNMIVLAESHPYMLVDVGVWDDNDMLFNTLNGVLDLDTFTLHNHERGFHITKIAPVQYNPNTHNVIWEKFIRDVMPDQDMRVYIQKAIGYSLTASIEEECLFFIHGSGQNGKSTFIDTIINMMGLDYVAQTSTETWMRKSYDGPRNDVYACFGRRLVSAAETEQGVEFDEEQLKQITGGGLVTVNPKYKDTFTFRPTWKLWFTSNPKPVIKGTDRAIWRRVRLIPFYVAIPPHKRDNKLKTVLMNDIKGRSGILNWALEGLRLWKEEGHLNPPKIVEEATREYRSEQDIVSQFLDECCFIHPDVEVSKRKLYTAFREYQREVGNTKKFLTLADFNAELVHKVDGIQDKRSSTERFWCGIKINQRVTFGDVEE